MRFVVAIVLFLAALATIGLGVAQRTVLAGPDSYTAEVVIDGAASAPVALIDGTALSALPGTQAVTIRGEGQVFVAYGRSADVRAWVGEASHREVAWDLESEALVSTLTRGIEDIVPNPSGSDLWVQEFSGVDELTRRINVPATATLLIASDGTVAAPQTISVSWPLDNSAPWSGPLIVAGGVLLVLGLAAFVWALIHARRLHGPRRRQPRLPAPPKPPQLKPPKKRKAITAGPSPVPSRRRLFVAVPLLAGAVLLAGCTSSSVPLVVPTPGETPPLPGAETLPAPAVTEAQLGRIVERVLATVSEADAALDTDIATQRLAGPALAIRDASYRIIKRDSGQELPAPLPSGPVRVILPQQTESWPRSVFAVLTDEEATVAPVAVMLVQASPRENYRVHYAMALEPNTVLPQVAAAAIGAPRLPADTALGLIAPEAIAEAYGGLLLDGEESESAGLFDLAGDTLLEQIGAAYKEEFADDLPNSAKVAFSNRPGEEEPIAFGTNDTGLLVAVEIVELEKVEPAESGAAINPRDSVRALVGKSQTTRGVEASYGLQLLFYVPPLDDTTARVELLGYTQGLIDAREL